LSIAPQQEREVVRDLQLARRLAVAEYAALGLAEQADRPAVDEQAGALAQAGDPRARVQDAELGDQLLARLALEAGRAPVQVVRVDLESHQPQRVEVSGVDAFRSLRITSISGVCATSPISAGWMPARSSPKTAPAAPRCHGR
jgi:hypothetical protein